MLKSPNLSGYALGKIAYWKILKNEVSLYEKNTQERSETFDNNDFQRDTVTKQAEPELAFLIKIFLSIITWEPSRSSGSTYRQVKPDKMRSTCFWITYLPIRT